MEHELWPVLQKSTKSLASIRKYNSLIKEVARHLTSYQVNYLIRALIRHDMPEFVIWVLENVEFTIMTKVERKDYWNSSEFDIFYNIFEKPFNKFEKVLRIILERPDFDYKDIQQNLISFGNVKWVRFFKKLGYEITFIKNILYHSNSVVNYLTKELKLDIPNDCSDVYLQVARDRREGFWRESMKTLWMSARRVFGRDVAHLLTSLLISTKHEGCWEIEQRGTKIRRIQ